jgi:hypothetical protein
MTTRVRLCWLVGVLLCLQAPWARGADSAPRLAEGEAVLAGLGDFRAVAGNWSEARALSGDPRREAVLQPVPGQGATKKGSGFAVCRSAMVALAVIDLGY